MPGVWVPKKKKWYAFAGTVVGYRYAKKHLFGCGGGQSSIRLDRSGPAGVELELGSDDIVAVGAVAARGPAYVAFATVLAVVVVVAAALALVVVAAVFEALAHGRMGCDWPVLHCGSRTSTSRR